MKIIVLYDERQDITLAAKAYPTADSWLADVDGRIFRIYDQAYVRWFRCYIREVVGIAQNVVMLGVEPVKGSGEIEYFKLGDINLVFDPFDQDSVEIDASAIGIGNQTASPQQQKVMSSGDIKRMMAGGTGIPASVFASTTSQKATVSAAAANSNGTESVDDIDYDHPSEQYRNIDDDFDTIDANVDDGTIDTSNLDIDVKPDVTGDETDTHSCDAKASVQKTDIDAADINEATKQGNATESKPTDGKQKPDEHQEEFHASDTVKHDSKQDIDDIPSDLFADLESTPDAETQETIDELRHMMYGDDEESFIFRDIELPDDDDDHMFYDLITGEKQKFHKMPQKTAGKKKASKRKQKKDDSGNITAKMSDDVRRSMESHIAEQQHTDDDSDKQMPDDRTDDNDANIESNIKQQHIDDMQAAGTARDITMHDETYAVVMDDIDDADADDDIAVGDVRDDADAADIAEDNSSDKKEDTAASDGTDSAADKKETGKQADKRASRKKENAKVSKSGVDKKNSNKKKGSDKGDVSDSDGAAAPSDDMNDAVSGDDAKGSDMGDEKPKRQLLSIDGMFDNLIEDDGYGSDVELDIDEFDLGDEAVSRINEMRDAAMRKAEEERQKVAEREAEQQGEQSMEDTLRHIASGLDIEIPDGVDAKMIVSVLDEMMMRRTAQDDVDAADASNDVEAETAADADADAEADIDEATSGKKKRSGKRSKKSVKKRDGRAEREAVEDDAVNEDSSVDGADADSKTDADQRSDADEIADAYMSMFDEQPTSDAMSVIEKFLKRYDDTVREQELRRKQMQGKVKSDGGSDDIDEVMADIEADIKASEESVKKRKSSKRKRPTSKKYVKTLHIDEESDGDDLMVETNVAAD